MPVPRRAARPGNEDEEAHRFLRFFGPAPYDGPEDADSPAKVFIGSENFSRTSQHDNRQLGLIISGHAVLSAMASTFAADFRNGTHWA